MDPLPPRPATRAIWNAVSIALLLAGCAEGTPQYGRSPSIPPIPVLPAPPPPWNYPDGLMGETPDAVKAKLGSPVLDATSGARIMDFQGEDCVLSVFFRLESDDWRAYEVMHILADGDNIDPNPCYRSIIQMPQDR